MRWRNMDTPQMNDNYILVTGGAGSIGSEIVRQLAPNNHVYILDINETGLFDLYEELKQKGYDVYAGIGDIRTFDFHTILHGFGKPDYIFHAAALKHVTPSSWNPKEYVETNILGTLRVVEFARLGGIKLINISTDKIINANSIMGATKKVAEIIVKNANFVSVRFGNVLGSRGSVIPIWQKQIDEGLPLTITDSRMERYMMTIPQAVHLVIEAARIGKEWSIMILDMGKPIKILDLAKEIIERSGKQIEIKEIGIRPGETLTEKLMTEEEEQIAVKEGNFWII